MFEDTSTTTTETEAPPIAPEALAEPDIEPEWSVPPELWADYLAMWADLSPGDREALYDAVLLHLDAKLQVTEDELAGVLADYRAFCEEQGVELPPPTRQAP